MIGLKSFKIENSQVDAIFNRLEANKDKARSAWKRGCFDYAIYLFNTWVTDQAKYNNNIINQEICLNGAYNWNHYSESGSAYIYSAEIAKILCTPSELKRTKNGAKDPNKNETWLDVQGRALSQAFRLLYLTVLNNRCEIINE